MYFSERRAHAIPLFVRAGVCCPRRIAPLIVGNIDLNYLTIE